MTTQASIHAEPAVLDDIRLQCPVCSHSLVWNLTASECAASCVSCDFVMRLHDGIWRAMPPNREEYFSQFIADYESVRRAEQRGSTNGRFYLELPYRDITGTNQHQWNVRSRSYDELLASVIGPRSNRKLRLLDIGAGNGWWSYRLRRLGHKPVAVDLLTNNADGLQAAEHFRRHLPAMFTRVQAEIDHLPFAREQFDGAIFNASFHYSENYVRTFGEAYRCVAKGGFIAIVDTPWYSSAAAGAEMVREKRQRMRERFGFPSDSIASGEYITDETLDELAREFLIRWQVLEPFYGIRWKLRPLIACLKRRREPSQFRIYVAEVLHR